MCPFSDEETHCIRQERSPGDADVLVGAEDVDARVCQHHARLGRILYRELCLPALPHPPHHTSAPTQLAPFSTLPCTVDFSVPALQSRYNNNRGLWHAEECAAPCQPAALYTATNALPAASAATAKHSAPCLTHASTPSRLTQQPASPDFVNHI